MTPRSRRLGALGLPSGGFVYRDRGRRSLARTLLSEHDCDVEHLGGGAVFNIRKWWSFSGGVGVLVMVVGACTPPPPVPERPPVISGFQVTATDLTAPAVVPLSWTVSDPNRDDLTCRVDFTTDGIWDTTTSPCPLTGGRNLSAGAGVGTATLEVSDGRNAAVTASVTYSVGDGPTEPYNIATFQVTPDPRVAAALTEAVSRWSAVLARGVPDMVVPPGSGACEAPEFDGELVDDMAIRVLIVPDLWAMATGASCALGTDGLPRAGVVTIHAGWIGWLHDNGYLGDLVVHEIGHVLGFGDVPWAQFMEGAAPDFWFSGPRAVAEWSRLGGVPPVPLNPVGNHWDDLATQNEVMSCYLEAGMNHPLSALTVAAMADLGYHVNLEAAEPWSLPTEPVSQFC